MDLGAALSGAWRGLRLAMAATVLGLCLLIVATHLLGLPHPHCPYRALGLRCPTCGLTGSVEAALNGHWRLSRQANPGGIPVLAFLSVVGLCQPLAWRVPRRGVIAANALFFVVGWIVLCVALFGFPGVPVAG